MGTQPRLKKTTDIRNKTEQREETEKVRSIIYKVSVKKETSNTF